MRTIRPATVSSMRTIVLGAIRAIAAVLLSVGGYMLIQRVLFATITSDWSYALKTFSGIGTFHPFNAGIALIVVGAVLGLLSRPLARWLTPVPDDRCPRCGYETSAPAEDRATRCTECGLVGVNNSRQGPSAPDPS